MHVYTYSFQPNQVKGMCVGVLSDVRWTTYNNQLRKKINVLFQSQGKLLRFRCKTSCDQMFLAVFELGMLLKNYISAKLFNNF